MKWVAISGSWRKMNRELESDVRNLSAKIPSKKIDAIVTEPYLGSPKAKFFSPSQAKKEIEKLTIFYLKAFAEFEKLIKNDGVIVIVFPVFRFKNSFYYLEILEEIYKLGLASRNFLFDKPKGFELLKLNVTNRNSIIFFRPGQSISREILVFTKISSKFAPTDTSH